MGAPPVRQGKDLCVIMLEVIILALVGYAAISLLSWLLGLCFKLLGWTVRIGFSLLRVLLLPLWLIFVLATFGITITGHVLAAIAVIWLVTSLLFPEG